MSDEYKTVAVRLSRNKKERWEDYVEESPMTTLSEVLRLAMEKEISRDDPITAPDTSGADSQEPSPEVIHKLDQISNKLQSMDRRLSAIESDRYGDEDLTELATEVYRILPSSVSEIQQAVALKENAIPGDESSVDIEFMGEAMDEDGEFTLPSEDATQTDRRPCTGSINDIATILDADKEAVQLAINRLQSTTHSVYSVESAAGTVHYYKED
ncbi:hypothetical protein ACFQJ5_09975 [Halomicroarcula sp. GCM10025324]|uniref:hypothetical protein n=1 Tax=Haloarcula TaxID=2237 RepID=UPI0023E80F61|nr:hypothetical protein [Halomicroarcula sp. ZS-22-S1]